MKDNGYFWSGLHEICILCNHEPMGAREYNVVIWLRNYPIDSSIWTFGPQLLVTVFREVIGRCNLARYVQQKGFILGPWNSSKFQFTLSFLLRLKTGSLSFLSEFMSAPCYQVSPLWWTPNPRTLNQNKVFSISCSCHGYLWE